MAGPGICVLCLADTCTSEVHPVFNHVAPYGYLLSDMYLFMADITNPDFIVLSCRTWIGLDINRFCEQQRQPSSGSAWPACPKNGKSGPHCWGRGGSTQFAQQLESAVTAPPLVGCVVWSYCDDICMCVVNKQFELEFVFDSVYVDMPYDEIYLTFTAGSVWCVRSHVAVLVWL